MPPLQDLPDATAHSALVMQLAKHVVVAGSHLYGEQSVGTVAMQLPLASHFLAPMMALARHWGLWQMVPAG